ncbi:AN1-type zinc finger domain-containing protein [Haloparvum sp. PAK95]|uniref:AN1-type zinc finger domain-containing protein n=1 Tax=Haloparvum sp. PAK95 TaxID=3418962 RepID=UPI003D2F21D5
MFNWIAVEPPERASHHLDRIFINGSQEYIHSRFQRMTQNKTCEYCSDEIPRNYFECNFCGLRHCSDHRLPETHDCLGLKLARRTDLDIHPSGTASPERILDEVGNVPDSDNSPDEVANYVSDQGVPDLDRYEEDQSVAYDTVDPVVYSSTPDPEFDSSPDVNLDGSIDRGVESTEYGESVNNGRSSLRFGLGLLIVIILVSAVVVFVFSQI